MYRYIISTIMAIRIIPVERLGYADIASRRVFYGSPLATVGKEKVLCTEGGLEVF